MKIKQYRALLILLGVLALLAGICAGVLVWLGGQLPSQVAAARWAGESDVRFAQVSVYFPVDAPMTLEQVRQFRDAIPPKLLEASLESNEESQLWVDAYSTKGRLTASTDYGEAEATAYAVGGDFFQFHPLDLVSGSYFSEDTALANDLVVLDEMLAWKLYGGMDLTGKTVEIQDKLFVVSGVVRAETDFASQRAETDSGRLYLSYNAYTELTGGTLADGPGLQCYELIMADPISGFARGLVTDRFSEADHVVVENSGRFSWERILGVLGDFGERSMNTRGVIFPGWENAARLVEDYMAVALLLFLLFLALPVLFILLVCVELLRRGWKRLKAWIPEQLEARRARRYAARQGQ